MVLDKQLAAVVAKEKAARHELKHTAWEEDVGPARRALDNAIYRRNEKRIKLEDAQAKFLATTKALEHVEECREHVLWQFNEAQRAMDKALDALEALDSSGDAGIKDENGDENMFL